MENYYKFLNTKFGYEHAVIIENISIMVCSFLVGFFIMAYLSGRLFLRLRRADFINDDISVIKIQKDETTYFASNPKSIIDVFDLFVMYILKFGSKSDFVVKSNRRARTVVYFVIIFGFILILFSAYSAFTVNIKY